MIEKKRIQQANLQLMKESSKQSSKQSRGVETENWIPERQRQSNQKQTK
jgi:hypothetical protein